MTRIRGTITRVLMTRGFGFVLGDDGYSYFVNADQLPPGDWERTKVDARVEFLPLSGGTKGNGLRATEVTLC